MPDKNNCIPDIMQPDNQICTRLDGGIAPSGCFIATSNLMPKLFEYLRIGFRLLHENMNCMAITTWRMTLVIYFCSLWNILKETANQAY